jgi:DNA-binding transcriptional LysR family regulator
VTTAIAERCRRKFPGVHLTIAGSWRQQAQADRLAADLALTFRPEDDMQFLAEPLVQDELVLACSTDDRQVPTEIDLAAVFQQDLIVPSPSHYIRRLIENAALSLGQELRIDCEIDSFELMRELVARRMAKALLPIACVREGLRSENLRVVRITNPPLQRTLSMLHFARQARSDAVDLVCQEVRTIIFECADRATFGWCRIPMADPIAGDPWHDDHALEASLDGHSPTSVGNGVFDLGHA